MKKNILASIFALAIIMVSASVTPAYALSASDIQTQIKELLAKVADLTRQLNALKEGSSTTLSGSVEVGPPPSVSKHRICSVLNRNLSVGTRGEDVRGLQEFLNAEGYLSASATGYFGPMTAQAVAKWQNSQGVSAVGALGPLSRDRIKVWCGIPPNTERFSATPSRGDAPLTVVFDTWLSGFRPQNIYFTIDFGDGSSERAADCFAPADACQSPGQNKHTYSSNGTYTATLNKITDPCAGQLACKAAIHSEVVAKTQIYVGPVMCTKEYKPVCGAKPIFCITTPCNPIQQTYSNRCMMGADGATLIYEGECKDTNANKPPVISGLSGPTTLSVNQTGTWTINASDPENGQLSYQLWWGDENVYTPSMQNSSFASREFVQTTTFTHAYTNAGTYTVTVVVRDNSGQEAKTSTAVRVGDTPIACTMQYDPVCGRPAGCANTCPPGMICAAMCQLQDPQTYGNRCQLDALGAEFLYSGQCMSTTNTY